MNQKKTKVMRIGETEDMQVIVKREMLEQVDNYKYLGNTVTNDWSSWKEIKTRIGMTKEAFMKKSRTLCSKLDLNLRKRIAKVFVWSVMLHACETWTILKKDRKKIKAKEMWIWRKMLGIKWTDKIGNEQVLERIGEGRYLYETILKNKRMWLGHVFRGSCFLREVIEGTVERV